MSITPDLPLLDIHNLFTNARISINVNKHSLMSLATKDYFVKQISHLSKGVVIVVTAQCQFAFKLLNTEHNCHSVTNF